MTLKELFDRILLRSGQFVMARSRVELNEDSFKLLAEEALAIYSKHNPIEKYFHVEVNDNRTYTFTEANTCGAGIPRQVSSVTPIRIIGVNPWILRQRFGISLSNADTQLDIRQECPYEYRAPRLTLPYSGEFEVLVWYRHEVKKMDNPDGTISYDLPTIEASDNNFLDLTRGMFLEGLGRSRRAFTLNDLPITMDADRIADEGKELVENARQAIAQASKFYLSFGG
jgi:hypothetical protein